MFPLEKSCVWSPEPTPLHRDWLKAAQVGQWWGEGPSLRKSGEQGEGMERLPKQGAERGTTGERGKRVL